MGSEMLNEMRSSSESDDDAQYATSAELEAAFDALSDEEYAKLMTVAQMFCRKRHLSARVLEPEELLSEAVKLTLQRKKRWRKDISLIKHLDRAMENISGHTVSRALKSSERIVRFPDGLGNLRGESESNTHHDSGLARIESQERIAEILAIFGDDTECIRLIQLKAKGYTASEIRKQLGISPTRYETISRRIRRTILKSRETATT